MGGSFSPGRSTAGAVGGVVVRGTMTGVVVAAGAAGVSVAAGTAEAAAVPTAFAGRAPEADEMPGVVTDAGTAEAAAVPPAAAGGDREAGEALSTGTMVAVEVEVRSCGWMLGEPGGALKPVDDTTGVLLVTGGLLVPSPKPSRRPPKKPLMGGSGGSCALHCCA